MVQIAEIARFIRGFHHRFPKLPGSVAPKLPVTAHRHPGSGLLCDSANNRDFVGMVGVKGVDAHHRRDSGPAHDADVVQQVCAARFHPVGMGIGIGRGQGFARNDPGSAAVGLHGPHRGDDHRGVGDQTRSPALEVPEFFETDVRRKAGLRNMVFRKLQSQAVGDDRALADGDVGERSGVDKHRLAFEGLHQGGVDGLHHPGAHGSVNLKVRRCHRLVVAVEGHDHASHALPQVRKIPGHRQNRHDFTCHGYIGAGFHGHAVEFAPKPRHHVAQALGAEIQNPADLNLCGVDIQPPQMQGRQGGVIVIELVLHPGVEGHHGKVVGIAHGVDVAGKPQTELGAGHNLGKPAPGGAALDVHGGTAGRLPHGGADPLAQLAQSLHQADGGGAFTLAQGRGGHGGNVDVFTPGTARKAFKGPGIIHPGQMAAIGQQFVVEQSRMAANVRDGTHGSLRSLRNFPILVHFRVQHGEYPDVFRVHIRPQKPRRARSLTRSRMRR